MQLRTSQTFDLSRIRTSYCSRLNFFSSFEEVAGSRSKVRMLSKFYHLSSVQWKRNLKFLK